MRIFSRVVHQIEGILKPENIRGVYLQFKNFLKSYEEKTDFLQKFENFEKVTPLKK